MKPGYRDNTPRNVRIAIRQVMKFDPIAGLVFHFAMDGVDPQRPSPLSNKKRN